MKPLLFPLFFGLILLSAPFPAAAHEFEPERQVLVQVFPDHVDVAILYLDAPGPRSDLFGLQFGFLHDAEGPLQDFARQSILPRLLDGLQFEVRGESPRTTPPEVRLDEHLGRLAAAAFVRYELSPLQYEEERIVIVRALDQPFQPTTVLIYDGQGLVPVDRAPEVVTLLRGRQTQASFRLPSPEDAPPPVPDHAPASTPPDSPRR